MITQHKSTKTIQNTPDGKITCDITRDFTKNKISVALNDGQSKLMLTSISEISEMISVLQETRDDLEKDFKEKK